MNSGAANGCPVASESCDAKPRTPIRLVRLCEDELVLPRQPQQRQRTEGAG